MANFISPATVQKIGALLSDGHSHRAIARGLNIKRTTVARYAVRLQPEKCFCGKEARHKGWCGPRYLKSSVHKELLAKIHSDFIDPPKPAPRKSFVNSRGWRGALRTEYPYCTGGPGYGNALLMSVNAVVPKRIPNDARADICQDLLLAILDGDLKLEDLIRAVKQAVQKRLEMLLPKHVI